MTIVQLSKTTALPADADTVWAFVSDFGGYASWQPHIDAVEMQPNGDRKVDFTRGDSVFDRIASQDDAARTLTYELVPGQPGPMQHLAATFTVREAGEGSEVEYAIEADVPDEMQDMARMGIGADIDGALNGLNSQFGA
ncbi:SRPBCC family protein [Aeromicrobium wangtongii]|uniref:SRPBCC family protein n=1 Tax=Aeromicrobium wangtongii TaxID=2969247 RepID=A0ABY5M6Z5_9ACTN|nr:SRPBCC family protein [Aeromicrobium wangtongii]MCD9199068.1 SRPBCC family protein [Aeromicrobium wangtongii]MCL3819996.1 SRPBCC family protein [Aeromicrobium wangtongii]UUP12901.1 SRPBCC family protein [Aeromicrobium wangtongii]